MTTIANVATQLLAESNYTTSDISAANLEYLIDNAIDYINLEAGTTIADLSGSAGTKTLTATDGQIAVIKPLSILLLRAFVDRGPNASVSGVSVTTTIVDPQYDLLMTLVGHGIQRLREPPIYVANDPVPTSE